MKKFLISFKLVIILLFCSFSLFFSINILALGDVSIVINSPKPPPKNLTKTSTPLLNITLIGKVNQTWISVDGGKNITYSHLNGTIDYGHLNLLFADDFSGYEEGSNGTPIWNPISGNWTIESGRYKQSNSSDVSFNTIAGDENWTNYTIEATIVSSSGTYHRAGIIFRYQNENQFYWFRVYPIYHVVELIYGPTEVYLKQVGQDISFPCRLKVKVIGNRILCYYNDELKINITHNESLKGKIGLRTRMADATFDNIDVYTDLPDGFHNVTVYVNDSFGNINSTVRYFTVDTTPPLWRDQMTNDTDNNITSGESILLTAQGYDINGLDYAWLVTNETGSWENKSDYGSPKDMNDFSGEWVWSNFTWNNSSIDKTTVIGWKICYNDTIGNINCTDVNTFVYKVPSLEIRIDSPLNKSYNTSWIWGNVTLLNKNGSWCGYSLDSENNQTMYNDSLIHWYYNISNLSEGLHSIKFYCNDTDGNLKESNVVYFTIDLTKPFVTVSIPENITYFDPPHNSLSLDFNTNEKINWVVYSLNDRQNISLSPVLILDFENRSILPNFTDLSPYGNDAIGVPKYGGYLYSENGKYGGCLLLNGEGDHLDIPGFENLHFSKEITISFWIKPDYKWAWDRIIEKDGSFRILFNNNPHPNEKLRFEFYSGGSLYQIDSKSSIPIGEWTHVVVTYDGTSMKIFLNGKEDAVKEYLDRTIDSSSSILRIGSDAGGVYSFDGKIDELRIYNKSINIRPWVGVLNPSFEFKTVREDVWYPSDYHARYWREEKIGGTPQFFWVTDVVRSGKYALKIVNNDSNDNGYLAQNPNRFKPDVIPGVKYTEEVWIKTANMSPEANQGVRLFFLWWDKNWNNFASDYCEWHTKNYTEWTKLTCSAVAPVGAVKGDFVIQLLGKGILWVDDVNWTANTTEPNLIHEGQNKVIIYARDVAGNVNSSIRYFNVANPPKWQSLGQNNSNPLFGESVELFAEAIDESGLDYAWLATNESGKWENKTDKVIDMNDSNVWKWTNFTWGNLSVPKGTVVSWKIYFKDIYGNVNATDEMSFIINRAPKWKNIGQSVLDPRFWHNFSSSTTLTANYILKCTWPNGAINRIPKPINNGWILPYESDIASLGLITECKRTGNNTYCEAARKWFYWWKKHQINSSNAPNSNLTGAIYELYNGSMNNENVISNNTIDSHVSAFLWAFWEYYNYTKNFTILQEFNKTLIQAADWLLKLQDTDGLLWDGYRYNGSGWYLSNVKYFADNFENYKGLDASAKLMNVLGNSAKEIEYRDAANKIYSALGSCYNSSERYFHYYKNITSCGGELISFTNAMLFVGLKDDSSEKIKAFDSMSSLIENLLDPSGGVYYNLTDRKNYTTYSSIVAWALANGMNIEGGKTIKQILEFVDSQINKNQSSNYYGGIHNYPGACSSCYYSFTSGWFILAVDAYEKIKKEVDVGESVELFAEAIDESGLDYAWLATNESGKWENKTDKVIDMNDSNVWRWTFFSWESSHEMAGKTIGWKVFYNDTYGTINETEIMTFVIKKLQDGSKCTNDIQCLGGYCVHGICRSTSTYCGDGYCDIGEVCSLDCGTISEEKAQPIVYNRQWDKILPNNNIKLLITKPELDLIEIEFFVNSEVNDAMLKIEKITSFPIQPPKGKIYQWFKIDQNNLEKSISNVKIKFKVNKTWVFSNNIDPTTIALNRWENNHWNKLNTSMINKDNEYIYYESKTPEFSYFVITGSERKQLKKCPICPNPTNWSECINNKQTRTIFYCNSTTNFTCQGFIESRECTKIEKTKKSEHPYENLNKYLVFYGIITVVGLLILRKIKTVCNSLN